MKVKDLQRLLAKSADPEEEIVMVASDGTLKQFSLTIHGETLAIIERN